MSVGVSSMDRTTLRGVAFWTAAVTNLMTWMISAIFAIKGMMPMASSMPDTAMVYSAMSVIGRVIHVLGSGSLFLFLGLIHYDLMTAQRLSEHARDYLIRDLTQSSQENKSNHG